MRGIRKVSTSNGITPIFLFCLATNGSKEKGPHDTPSSSSNRYFVKIQKSGVLCLQLAGNKKAATVQFYLGDKKCKCEPMTLGDTFHFILKGTQRLGVDATDSRSNSSQVCDFSIDAKKKVATAPRMTDKWDLQALHLEIQAKTYR